MTHAEIEERQITERYLQGKLSAEEIAQFEEHYLSCAECLDRLDTAEELAFSLKEAVAEGIAQVAAVRQLALVSWLARLGRSRQTALLVSLFLVVLALPTLVYYRGGRLVSELRDARSALAASTARERAGQASAERTLAHERQERAALARDLAQARAPQADVPLLFLGGERGRNSAGEPTYRLRLPRHPGTVVLSVPVEPAPDATWRVVLARAGTGGAEIWRSAPLAVRQETLAVALPSALLAPGDYVLQVVAAASGASGAGGSGSSGGTVARFSFRVLPPLPD